MVEENAGANRLARLFQSWCKEAADRPQAVDLGTVQPNMSLLTNTFPQAIPASDYMIARHLSGVFDGARTEFALGGDYRHDHAVPIPRNAAAIAPGDRVLVLFVGEFPDVDAVVVDVVIPMNGGG